MDIDQMDGIDLHRVSGSPPPTSMVLWSRTPFPQPEPRQASRNTGTSELGDDGATDEFEMHLDALVKCYRRTRSMVRKFGLLFDNPSNAD
jgi:hypothetical protein